MTTDLPIRSSDLQRIIRLVRAGARQRKLSEEEQA